MTDDSNNSWRDRNVWTIALSAFFADLGYQTVLAGFPILLVIMLKQPYWEYGVATAISYGGGAVFSYMGAKIGSRVGHKRLALIGNSAIPLLSLCGLIANPAWAIGFLVGGWWSRNLRSPSRRVMLVEAVPDKTVRAKAFGFMHALDIGGGVMASIFLIVALLAHLNIKWIFLITIIPLLVSTYSLSQAHVGELSPRKEPDIGKTDIPNMENNSQKTFQPLTEDEQNLKPENNKDLLSASKKIIIASLLYGFTFYSTGFLVLTTAKSEGSNVGGIISYLLVQLASAITGYLIAPKLAKSIARQFISLATFGYIVGALGTALIAASAVFHFPALGFDMGVLIIGFSLGIIDTLEPATMSLISKGQQLAKGFGSLAAARSLGTFSANLIMGLLYEIGVAYAYGYATILAIAAAIAVLLGVPAVIRYEKSHN